MGARKTPVWLVWALTKSGETVLRAIDTTPKVAERHRLALVNEGNQVRVHVEETLTNHLYGEMDERMIQHARRWVQRRTGD